MWKYLAVDKEIMQITASISPYSRLGSIFNLDFAVMIWDVIL